MKYFVSFLFYYYCTEKVFLLSKTKKTKILPSQFSWWFSNSLAVIYFFHTKRKWNVYVRNTKRLMMIERNTKCSVNFFWKKKRFSFVGWWLTNCVVWWGQIALECINALWRRSAGGKVFTLFDKRVQSNAFRHKSPQKYVNWHLPNLFWWILGFWKKQLFSAFFYKIGHFLLIKNILTNF